MEREREVAGGEEMGWGTQVAERESGREEKTTPPRRRRALACIQFHTCLARFPNTNRRASMTLDLPEPLGPTTEEKDCVCERWGARRRGVRDGRATLRAWSVLVSLAPRPRPRHAPLSNLVEGPDMLRSRV